MPDTTDKKTTEQLRPFIENFEAIHRASATKLFSELLSRPDGKKMFFDAVVSAFKTMHGSLGGPFDPYNVDAMHRLACGIDSCEYASANMAGKPRFASREQLLSFAIKNIRLPGPVLEFGVFSGHTINHIASILQSSKIYGFDSFEGLPEAWFGKSEKGLFSAEGKLPKVRANVELIVGWFDRTLPAFLDSHSMENISLLHIDCDIYSSTQTIFSYLYEKIVPGTIIVFDEYFNYPEWKRHEFRAFQEFVNFRQRRYEYIGLVPVHEQVAIRILG
jgi:hypothetical protein